MKVLYLTNIPSPYRVAFFEELGRLCDLTVLYERRLASDRHDSWAPAPVENFTSVYMRGFRAKSDSALCFGVLRYMLDPSYDVVVVGGYSTPTGILATLALRSKRARFWINIDGGFPEVKGVFRRSVKKFLLGAASWHLSPGGASDEYLTSHGIAEEGISHYPFSSVKQAEVADRPASRDERLAIRRSLGIVESQCVLAIGQFIHRKGFDLLIEAAQKLGEDVGVYIVGGEPPSEYLSLRDSLAANNVHFVGFRDTHALIDYYRAADVFAMPTRYDVWGLVVNEALAQGLPVVASDMCGSALEMIDHGINGYVVPSGDVEALADVLGTVLAMSASERSLLSDSALTTGRAYTIEAMAEAHISAFTAHPSV